MSSVRSEDDPERNEVFEGLRENSKSAGKRDSHLHSTEALPRFAD
jgi:hypothetical protein